MIDRHFMNRRHFLASLTAGAVAAAPLLTSRRSAAALQTPESSREPELLFKVVFLRDWQPSGKAQGAFYRIILEPGQSLTYLPGPYCGCSGETIQEGAAAERVMSGTYRVRLDRPFIVRRNGGDDQEFEAETEVELTGGDVAIYPDALAFGDLRNAG